MYGLAFLIGYYFLYYKKVFKKEILENLLLYIFL